MLQQDERELLISLSLDKSENKLNAAKSFCESYPNEAASAAYYSAFHSMHALFLQHHLVDTKKRGHRSGIALFNREFIRTGIFPVEMGKIIGQLEGTRNTSDYSTQENISQEKAANAIEKAEKFNAAIRKHIQEERNRNVERSL